MKLTRTLVATVALTVTCLFAKSMVDYDKKADFGKYHTYSWINVDAQEPLWKDRIATAIDTQLTSKGWRKVPSGGDAGVAAMGSTKTQQTYDTWYTGGFGGGWFHRGWWGGAPGMTETTVENTPIGTLHVDIFDGATKKVIWHASVSDALSSRPEKNENKLDKDVAEMFKNFPPPEKK